jgi:hypothetical protein
LVSTIGSGRSSAAVTAAPTDQLLCSASAIPQAYARAERSPGLCQGFFFFLSRMEGCGSTIARRKVLCAASSTALPVIVCLSYLGPYAAAARVICRPAESALRRAVARNQARRASSYRAQGPRTGEALQPAGQRPNRPLFTDRGGPPSAAPVADLHYRQCGGV